jgi:hypothetical protein
MHLRCPRKVALKLYPIQPLDVLRGICLNESMQLAIGKLIERPANPAGVLNCLGKPDTYRGIVPGDQHIPIDAAPRDPSLGVKKPTTENDNQDSLHEFRLRKPDPWTAAEAICYQPNRANPNRSGHKFIAKHGTFFVLTTIQVVNKLKYVAGGAGDNHS